MVWEGQPSPGPFLGGTMGQSLSLLLTSRSLWERAKDRIRGRGQDACWWESMVCVRSLIL